MLSKDILAQVKILWNYMKLNESLHSADCILGLGCHDINVAERCAQLFHAELGKIIIFSGGWGKLTKSMWHKSEAEKFADIAISLGVPKNKIYIETNSTNTGDNFILTRRLIEKEKLSINSFIVVTKPSAERRIRATFEKRMPDYQAMYTSPTFSFEEYMSFYEVGPVSQEDLICTLVGDIQRFEIYYRKGFQVYVEVPQRVLDAYHYLINCGFNKYLIT